MTNDQLREAMLSKTPVTHRGLAYSHISAIIYRASDTGVFLQAELLDPNQNCVVMAKPAEVEFAEVGSGGAAT